MKTCTVIALLLLVTPGLTAIANAANDKNSSANASSPTSQITDRQIRNFAATREAINRIREKYRAALKSADTTAERKRVFRQHEKAVGKALHKHDMTASKFRQMAVTIRDTPELRKKLEAMEPDG